MSYKGAFRKLEYREARELLKSILNPEDAKQAVLILYRLTGANKRTSREAVLRIAEDVRTASTKARGDVNRKPFQKQSPLWAAL
jgi:hypothetical protein